MIKGLGIDIVDKDRISKILDRQNVRFIERILTDHERMTMPEGRAVEFLAGRFAVKEAFAKATGFGIGKKLSWHDVEVMRDTRGKPFLNISPVWLEQFYPNEQLQFHVSISHEKKYAVAQVIIEC